MNHLEQTRQTYRRIAAAYAQAQQEPGASEEMKAQLDQFAALLAARRSRAGRRLWAGNGYGRSPYHPPPASHRPGLQPRDDAGRSRGAGPPGAICSGRYASAARGQSHDGLWVCASLLHLAREEVLPTLQEFHRVLRPGGVLYLSVKLGDGAAWVPTPYDQTHQRFFTYWQPELLDSLLETAAFHIIDGWQESGRRDTWLVRYARKEEPQR
jgi:SAM-dependent methyltransferase